MNNTIYKKGIYSIRLCNGVFYAMMYENICLEKFGNFEQAKAFIN